LPSHSGSDAASDAVACLLFNVALFLQPRVEKELINKRENLVRKISYRKGLKKIKKKMDKPARKKHPPP
jgi:hypothetical protein